MKQMTKGGGTTYSVFISHTSKDRDLAEDLAQRLEAAGLKVLRGPDSFSPGQQISSVISKDLRDADEVIIVVSANSIDSPNLMFESGAAFSAAKRITLLAVGVEATALPAPLRYLNFVRYSHVQSYIGDLARRAYEGARSEVA